MNTLLPLKAITVHQPWAWSFTDAGKRVENRSWPPNQGLAGNSYLAVHAGQRFVLDAYRDLQRAGHHPPPIETLVHGAIVCVGFLERVIEHGDDDMLNFDFFRSQSDQYGWVLRDVVNIVPVPCRGRQKIWTMPDHVLSVVRERAIAAGL